MAPDLANQILHQALAPVWQPQENPVSTNQAVHRFSTQPHAEIQAAHRSRISNGSSQLPSTRRIPEPAIPRLRRSTVVETFGGHMWTGRSFTICTYSTVYVCMHIYLHMYVEVYIYLYIYIYTYTYVYTYMYIHLSVYLSVYPSPHLFFIYLYTQIPIHYFLTKHMKVY